MALNIKDPETHELARALAARRGTTLTEAVNAALREALRRSEGAARPRRDRLEEIARHCASLPVRDARSPDEILGYDDDGLPG